jgi:hypothetical protein
MSAVNSPLFGLISFAGNASLGELRARSSIAVTTLAREIVDMVRNGTVTLSPGPYAQQTDRPDAANAVVQAVMALSQNPKAAALANLGNNQEDVFVDAVQSALNDDEAASSINVSPTSKGFRYNP